MWEVLRAAVGSNRGTGSLTASRVWVPRSGPHERAYIRGVEAPRLWARGILGFKRLEGAPESAVTASADNPAPILALMIDD